MERHQQAAWSIIVAAAVLVTACGDSKSSLNPTAPSLVTGGALSEASGATSAAASPAARPRPNNGNGNGNGGGSNNSPAPAGQAKVELEGLVTAVGNGTLTVNGQLVSVPPSAVIRHGSTPYELSDLRIGDRVHVRAVRVESTQSLEATEVFLQNPGDGGAESPDPEPARSSVGVEAVDAHASEPGTDTGMFRLTRSGDASALAGSLTVSFTLGGSATNGVDYQNTLLTATFAAGVATVDVMIVPLSDSLLEGEESVVLTLGTDGSYDIGLPSSASIGLTDPVPLVSVSAPDALASEAGTNRAFFRLFRTGSTVSSLTVTIALTGTATNGVDYQAIATTATFAAGRATLDVWVVPVLDAEADGPETVVLTVLDGVASDVGTPASATVTITES